jgi:hypothetical protein
MGVETSTYIDVQKKAAALKCNVPADFAILPINFNSVQSKSDLVQLPATLALRRAFRASGIIETPLEHEKEKFPVRLQESAYPEWVIPTIFVANTFINQHPHLVDLLLNVVSNFVADWIKGVIKNDKYDLQSENVYFNLVVEKQNRKTVKLTYKGQVKGLKEIRKLIDDLVRKR